MRFSLDDLARWDGRLPVVLVGAAASVPSRRRALRDFARRVTGDAAAEVEHDDGSPPRLVGHPRIQLSSASRDGLATFAAASGGVGVDVERADAGAEPPLGVLHPAERDALARCLPADRARVFASIWAGKEAYLKALGTGLSRDPGSFRIALPPDGPAIVDGPDRIALRLEEHRLDGNLFLVALVTLPRPDQ